MTAEVNTRPVERIYPHDERVKPQTIAHHVARYDLASRFRYGGGAALDLACGSGYGSEMLRRAEYHVVGVDISDEALTYAREHFPECDFRRCDLATQFPEGKFNIVTFFEALEHLEKDKGMSVLRNVSASLAEGGMFFMSIPRDINPVNNGFHKSEWKFPELKTALEATFRKVTIYGQDWDSAIISATDPENDDFFVAMCAN